MATLLSPSLAVIALHPMLERGILQDPDPKIRVQALSAITLVVPATIQAVDEERGFAVLQLAVPVPRDLPPEAISVSKWPEGANWQTFFFRSELDQQGWTVQGTTQGQFVFGGRRYWRLNPSLSFLGSEISGAPVIVDNKLVGIVALADKKLGFLCAVSVTDMAESKKTDAVRSLLPTPPAGVPDTLVASFVQAQPKPQLEQEPGESIEISSISDTPTDKDALGFKPYVEAISRFLRSPATKPPLTLSIEGEWGGGKSSFMLQLKSAVVGQRIWKRLKRSWIGTKGSPEATLWPGKAPTRPARLWKALWEKPRLSVQFNPWRHDKEESLWAAFALEFLRQISRQRWLLRRWWGAAQLFWAHYSWRSGWIEALRAVVVCLVIAILVVGLPIEVLIRKPVWVQKLVAEMSQKQNSPGEDSTLGLLLRNRLLQVGGGAAYYAAVLTIWLKAKDVLGNPLEINLKKYLRSPDYEGRVSFVEQFHEDFRRIVDAYAGKEKVFVFIDDLDRCEVPKAADLMKAVNLLIADDPRLVFIVGMDREKVVAGLAVQFQRLLPYLSRQTPLSRGNLEWKRRVGLEFGQAFLQKFVQLPFRVPEPNPENYGDFIRTISAPAELGTRVSASAAAEVPEDRPSPPAPTFNAPEREDVVAQIPSAPRPTPAQVQVRRTRELQFGGDSDKVRAIALMVADTLGRNPRRLKQFVNLFRLQAYIVNEIGLFDPGLVERAPITFEQLGKFVAISLWWPEILADFSENPKYLGELQENANQKKLGDSRLQRFMEYGMEKEKEKYTLSNPSLSMLLHICPQRIRVVPSTKPSVAPIPT
jgi:hypothetical protein